MPVRYTPFTLLALGLLSLVTFTLLTYTKFSSAEDANTIPPEISTYVNTAPERPCRVLAAGVSNESVSKLLGFNNIVINDYRKALVESVDAYPTYHNINNINIDEISVFMVNLSDPAAQVDAHLVSTIGRKLLLDGKPIIFLSADGTNIDKLKEYLIAMLDDKPIVLKNILLGLGSKVCTTITVPKQGGNTVTKYCTFNKKIYVFMIKLVPWDNSNYTAPVVYVFSADPNAVVDKSRIQDFIIRVFREVVCVEEK